MSAERGTIPTPSGDPFYDALIKRLYMADDGRTEYVGDAFSFTGSTEQIDHFKLVDYWMVALKEAPPQGQRNPETRRALLARGIGFLTMEVQVKEEESRRSYHVVRPTDLVDGPSAMYGQPFMHEQYPDLDNYDLSQPSVFRFMPTPEETIIDAPLEHPYLREVYEEIVSTF